MTTPAVHIPAGLHGPGADLVGQARIVLEQARAASATADPGERFRLAHLAALRAAAALIACRGRPASARGRLVNIWLLLERVAPEFAEWARYFASGASTRAAVEAGAVHAVSGHRADDEVCAAGQLLELVERALGILEVPLAS